MPDSTFTAATRSLLWGVGLVIGVSLLIIVVLNTVVTRRLLRPISHTARAMEDIARGEGDLTRRLQVSSNDELGELARQFNAFVERMQGTLKEVRKSTYAVLDGSQQVSQGAEELAARTEQQAASLQETAASMEEITSTVKQNADNARQASAAGQRRRADRRPGRRGGASGGRAPWASINDSSQRIADIIRVIDSHRLPDQHPRPQRLGGGGAGRRAGPRLRRGGPARCATWPAAARRGGAGDPRADRASSRPHRVQDGTKLVEQAGETMREVVDAVTRVTDIIDEISARLPRAERRHRPDQHRGGADGCDDPGQCGDGPASLQRRAQQMRESALRLGELVDGFILGDEEPAAGGNRNGAPQTATRPSRSVEFG